MRRTREQHARDDMLRDWPRQSGEQLLPIMSFTCDTFIREANPIEYSATVQVSELHCDTNRDCRPHMHSSRHRPKL